MFKRLSILILAALFIPSSLLAAPQKAVFVQVKGKVSVLQDEKTKPAKVGMSVVEGDEILCESGSARVVLKTDAGNEIRLKGKTRVRFSELQKGATSQKTRLELLAGQVWAAVSKLKTAGSRFEIKAGGVVCGVRGTTLGGRYDPKKDKGRFKNHKGKIRVTGKGGSGADVPEGQYCDFGGGLLGAMGRLSDDDGNEFKWKGADEGDDGAGGAAVPPAPSPGGGGGGDVSGSNVALDAAAGGADDTLGGFLNDTVLSSDDRTDPGRLILGFEFPERVGEPIEGGAFIEP